MARVRLTPPVFASLAVFVGISMLVVSGVTVPWDDAVLQWAGTVRTPGLTDGMLVVTFLGSGIVEVPVALGAVALLWIRAGRRSAMALLLAGVSGELAYAGAKAAFQRPRPDIIDKLSSAGWYSYPSGHAMLAPILWSLMLVLLAGTVPAGRRWPLLVLAVVMPIAIAVSRVYLGVHYPSDVLGALALGVAWLLLWLDWSVLPTRDDARAAPQGR